MISRMLFNQLGFRVALTLATVVAISAPCDAQMFPFSQRGTVSQTLAFTDIAVEYGRPTARGRVLFGTLVPWDKEWNPGADSATRITFQHDVLLETRLVKAGAYTVWLVPRASSAWTFILSRAVNVSHTPYPGASLDALRVDVMPTAGSHLEALTYFFPVVASDSAHLRMQWGEIGVSVRIKAPYRPQ